MIRLKNVSKIYRGETFETKALDHVDLDIKTNEFLAVMGSSGSGKTTLLNLLGGMDFLTEGEYEYDNLKIHEFSEKQLEQFRKEKISFIFQQFALMDKYTVFENIEMPLLAMGIKKKERKQIVEENMEKLGIAALRDKYPSYISGGQQQRTAIARALAKGSELILADEPTGALDQKCSEELMELFQTMHQLKKTIVMVTHNEKIATYAERIVRVGDGKVCSG
ncbi:MAG: ABC transporter ATP-binding protein [Roseburia sp.]|nr:ABC transporter ATP-binding protein [Roseburia sp.]MCM1278598.1 ABC transporter ATP-binding protein [Robinsoniella sp.]